VALPSPEDQGTIMAHSEIESDAIEFDELNGAFPQTLELLMSVAQSSQPYREVQMLCNRPQQIIDLQ
jgi:hypothetical protein